MKLLRVLEYDFSPESMQRQLDQNGVQRFRRVNARDSIRELVLGRETPLGQRLKLAVKIIRGTY